MSLEGFDPVSESIRAGKKRNRKGSQRPATEVIDAGKIPVSDHSPVFVGEFHVLNDSISLILSRY